MTKIVIDANNRRAFHIAALALLAMMVAPAPAAAEDVGGASGAPFLSLPVGARSIALGEAGTALPHDPFTWLSNPALMPFAPGSGIGAFHSQWTLDTSYGNVVAMHRLSGLISIGAAVTYLSSPDIPGFDETGAQTGDVANNNLQGIVGIGVKPLAGFGAGVNVKYLQEQIADYTARGWAVDLGAAWLTGVSGISFGAAVQNLGSDITYIERSETLPTTFRAGAVGELPILSFSLRIAADVVKKLYVDPYGSFGAELDLQSMVFLRAGYSTEESREGDRFSVGGGLRLFERLMIDYAWTPYGDLGSFHRISIFAH